MESIPLPLSENIKNPTNTNNPRIVAPNILEFLDKNTYDINVPIKTNTATFKYVVELDDNVVFPEKVRQKNDVKNLTVHVIANKCKDHYLGKD